MLTLVPIAPPPATQVPPNSSLLELDSPLGICFHQPEQRNSVYSPLGHSALSASPAASLPKPETSTQNSTLPLTSDSLGEFASFPGWQYGVHPLFNIQPGLVSGSDHNTPDEIGLGMYGSSELLGLGVATWGEFSNGEQAEISLGFTRDTQVVEDMGYVSSPVFSVEDWLTQTSNL